jgi:hypothetical protein
VDNGYRVDGKRSEIHLKRITSLLIVTDLYCESINFVDSDTQDT